MNRKISTPFPRNDMALIFHIFNSLYIFCKFIFTTENIKTYLLRIFEGVFCFCAINAHLKFMFHTKNLRS